MITAKDIMSTRVVIGAAEERLTDVAGRMVLRQAQHCVVLDHHQRCALGLIRFVDVAARSYAANRILADLISHVAPIKITDQEPANKVAALLESTGINEAIVEADDGSYLGLVTIESAFKWMLQEHRDARAGLEELLGERKRLNDLLEKKVEQRTNDLRTVVEEFRFASLSLSHDVRAPLRAIKGYAQMLAAGDAGELTPDGKFNAQAIQRAATKLELMAQEILDRAERTVAVNSPVTETIDLNVILEDAMEFHRDLLAERKAVVTKRGELGSVRGRYVPVLQIVANLLANAVKYVAVQRQPVIEVWSEDSPVRVKFCIKDNGPGVPQRHQNEIFEPFVRIPNSGRTGFGLGLAIAKNAALRIESEIGVSSDANDGSVFTVAFRKPTAVASTAGETA